MTSNADLAASEDARYECLHYIVVFSLIMLIIVLLAISRMDSCNFFRHSSFRFCDHIFLLYISVKDSAILKRVSNFY